VTFMLGPDELSFFDAGAGRFAVAPGRYRLAVGSSSRDLSEREDFTVGERR
jgi:hypothetical protein